MAAMLMDHHLQQQREQREQHQQHQQQQGQAYKHCCRICKKGFGCGRALGGHMRAHGINDEPVADPDDDPPPGCGGNWDDKQLNPPAGSKRMYALRTNPNRLRSCRICENCGKEFLSWKSFLEHGRCSSEDDSSPPSSTRSDNDDGGGPYAAATNWFKRKRTRRMTKPAITAATSCPSTEEEDLANCLVMLSAARVDPIIIAETEESSASASKDDDRRPPPPPNHSTEAPPRLIPLAAPAPPVPRGMFECKACKKVFTSHQALGGHRASHKKVKGCFAARMDVYLDDPPPEDEVSIHDNNTNIDQNIGPSSSAMALAIVPFENPQPLASAPLKKKFKIHECTICRRQFASGQALGGHKRCHWITSSSSTTEPLMVAAKLHHMPVEAGSSSGHHHELTLRPPVFDSSDILDLNQPAPVDNLAGLRQSMQGSPLRLDVPAAIYILPPWTIDDRKDGGGSSSKNKHVAATSSNKNNNETSKTNLDDEVDSNLKLAKLSELKDMNIGGERSPWLQVGIGSSAKEGYFHDP